MISIIQHIDHKINLLIASLDQARQFFLRFALKNNWLRYFYSNYEYRTLTVQIIWLCTVLPIAILRPDFLLIMGPLVFGYPHMIASYRYLIRRDVSTLKLRPQIFLLFSLFTALALVIYNFKIFFSFISFGVWSQVLAMLALAIFYFIKPTSLFRTLVLGSSFCLGLAIFAWKEPILYAGGFLMLHNLMAYLHWILSCKKRAHLGLAISSTILFLVIHGLVIYGFIDFLLNPDLLQQWRIQSTAWFLASWSEDPLVWNRWLVLYTFGLSMHYFVWLRALPEAELKSKAPLSFRLSWQEWTRDIGSSSLKITLLICLIGFGLWLFQYNWGKVLYFQIALLHGALEVAFLPSKLVDSHA